MIRASLRNPHAVVVLALGILVIGLTSVVQLPTDILPTFKTPAVQILTARPGSAGPDTGSQRRRHGRRGVRQSPVLAPPTDPRPH